MKPSRTPRRAHPAPEVPAGERFAARSLAALVGVVGAGVVFALLLVLVAGEWEPLRTADVAAVDGLNAVVSGTGWLVSVLQVATDLGSSYVSWTLLSVTVVWLLVRRAGRLAAWVAVTGLGAAVLDPGIKAAVGRVRPLVDVPRQPEHQGRRSTRLDPDHAVNALPVGPNQAGHGGARLG